MRIVYDNIIFSLQRAGGISVVWQHLLNHCLGKADISCLEYAGAAKNLSRKSLVVPAEDIVVKSLNPRVAELFSPGVPSRPEAHFIFHSSYYRTCNNPKAINVTTVHDFIYEYVRPTVKQRLRKALNYRAIRKSDAIVCVSENTRRDLLKFIPEIDSSKISVIHNGVAETFHKLDTRPFAEYADYVLFVGGRSGYKNFRFIVEALAGTKFKLLICGKPLSKSEGRMLDAHLPNRYRSIVFPSNEELNRIYNSVYALVYPSAYEGFGLPIPEAQRAGCPVIALGSSSVPEVAGNGAILLDSLTQDNLADALERLADREYRTDLIERGHANSQRFSWKSMAESYLKLYERLLKAAR